MNTDPSQRRSRPKGRRTSAAQPPAPSASPLAGVSTADYLTEQERNISLCESAYGAPTMRLATEVPKLPPAEARTAARDFTAPLLDLLVEALAPVLCDSDPVLRMRARVLKGRVERLHEHIAPLLIQEDA